MSKNNSFSSLITILVTGKECAASDIHLTQLYIRDYSGLLP